MSYRGSSRGNYGGPSGGDRGYGGDRRERSYGGDRGERSYGDRDRGGGGYRGGNDHNGRGGFNRGSRRGDIGGNDRGGRSSNYGQSGGGPGIGAPRFQGALPTTLIELPARRPFSAPSSNEYNGMLLRPGYGTEGKQMLVTSNFFKLTFPQGIVFQYDIDIARLRDGKAPDNKIKRNVKRLVFEAWKQHISKSQPDLAANVGIAIYDGEKNFYTMKPLLHTRDTTLEMDEPEGGNRKGIYQLRVQQTTTVDMSALKDYLNYNGRGVPLGVPRSAFAVLEILMRHQPALLLNAVGRSSFFSKDSVGVSIRDGLSVHLGCFQSVRPSSGQLLLNVDVSATAMYDEDTIVGLASKFLQTSDLNAKWQNLSHRDIAGLAKFLKGLKAVTTYNTAGGGRPMTYRIDAIDEIPVTLRHLDRPPEGGGPTETVAQYYLRAYGITLRYKDLPCVIHGTKNRKYFPMELLKTLPGQRFGGQVKPDQLAEMIKITSTNPLERFKRIMDGDEDLHRIPEIKTFLNAWEVNVDRKLVQLKARRLEIPDVFAGERTPLSIRNGSWQSKRLEVPSTQQPLKYWSILLSEKLRDTDYRAVEEFKVQLVSLLSQKGLNVVNQNPPLVDGTTARDMRGMLIKAGLEALAGVRGKPPQLVIVIVDRKNSPVHADIKRIAETELGMMTQCIALPNLTKRGNLRSYIENVILKINSKLGGSNTKVAGLNWLQQSPTMILGADVYHAGPNSKSKSIAAVVGSMDKEFTRFVAAIRAQESREETIAEMKGCMKELLETFRNCTGTSPARIIFFRDGVSEGQYETILRNEVQGIKDACKELSIPITVTFIIVTKRHHVRFIPTNSQDGDQKNGNCLPGTTIDYGINHPMRFDYYQYGSQGLLGTSRPAYYTVIFDEHKLSPDQVQDMTLRLCHLYQRANKSISLPAPVQYAHLTAYRARYYFTGTGPSTVDGTATGGETLLPIKDDLKHKMFFS